MSVIHDNALKAMPKKSMPLSGTKAKEIRLKLNMRQGEFWRALSVDQSVGSRYERGVCPLPPTTEKLLRMATAREEEAINTLMALRESFKAKPAKNTKPRRQSRQAGEELEIFRGLPFGHLP